MNDEEVSSLMSKINEIPSSIQPLSLKTILVKTRSGKKYKIRPNILHGKQLQRFLSSLKLDIKMPKIVYASPKAIIVEYIEGSPATPSKKTCQTLIKISAQLHNSPLNDELPRQEFKNLVATFLTTCEPETKTCIFDLLPQDYTWAVSHGDLLLNNTIISHDEGFYVIDYESISIIPKEIEIAFIDAIYQDGLAIYLRHGGKLSCYDPEDKFYKILKTIFKLWVTTKADVINKLAQMEQFDPNAFAFRADKLDQLKIECTDWLKRVPNI